MFVVKNVNNTDGILEIGFSESNGNCSPTIKIYAHGAFHMLQHSIQRLMDEANLRILQERKNLVDKK